MVVKKARCLSTAIRGGFTAPRVTRVGREGGGAWMEPAPEQREVEGRGGAFWYEVPH